MYNWLVVIPPLLVVISALITQRMILSFCIGIFAAGLIATNLHVTDALSLILTRFGESSGVTKITSLADIAHNWSIGIFTFLICVGILLVLLQYSGGAQAFQRIASHHITSRRSTEVASLLLSPFFFIDDYFSALTVGSVMKPLALLHQVHPIKLAFLVVAMAQPITILSPLSSWIGEIILQFRQVGISKTGQGIIISADPYYVFLQAIPFILYASLMIVGTWYIVLRRIAYGPMATYERENNSSPQEKIIFKKTSSLFDFIFPIGLLICSVFTMLLITGNASIFGGTNSIGQALKNGSVHQALCAGGLISVLASMLLYLLVRKITFSLLTTIVKEGAMLMIPSIVMLVCAWTLSLLLKQDLRTGDYIATLFSNFIGIPLFPLVCFVSSACVAWMIGSAWATMGLMFPITVPMLQTMVALPQQATLDQAFMVLPVIGATLSGCIMGTHLSLLSDNPIMAAASSGANHFKLVKAMSWYIVPIGIATGLAYLMLGTMLGATSPTKALMVSFTAGAISVAMLLELGQAIFGRK